jgi:hypothetical protein
MRGVQEFLEQADLEDLRQVLPAARLVLPKV